MTGGQAVRRVGAAAAVAAVVLAAAAGLVLLAGADPVVGLQGLVAGVSSSPYRVGELVVGAVPVALIALTLVPALRAGIFSVGAEGQVVVGAVAATAATFGVDALFGGVAGTEGPGAPAPLLWLAGALAGAAGGAAYALLPAVLAVRWRVDVILSTLLLNYVAAGFLAWSLRTWLASPEDTATPQSAHLPEAAAVPLLVEGTRAHWGALLVVVAAVLLALWRRSPGWTRVSVYGVRPRLALRLGATRARTTCSVMLVSGAGAGLVGWLQVAAVNERLLGSVSGGVGFSGVAVALLGGLLPLGVVTSAVFFAALTAGAVGLQSATGSVPSSIAEVVKGVLLLGVACLSAVGRPRALARDDVPDDAPPADAPAGAPTDAPADARQGTRA